MGLSLSPLLNKIMVDICLVWWYRYTLL